jgi:TusA-related sulfurtransferase
VKGLDPCFKFSSSFASKTITITGKPDQEGTYEFLIRGTGNTVVNANAYEIVRVIVTDPAGVSTVPVQTENNARIYTVSGMQIKGETLESLPQGIYIIREGCQTKKVLKK